MLITGWGVWVTGGVDGRAGRGVGMTGWGGWVTGGGGQLARVTGVCGRLAGLWG